MARYTCSFTVAVGVDRLRQLLAEILHSCNLDLVYDNSDYMMAREQPGMVPFSKLVTVEVLIDKITATTKETQIIIVVKSEELALMVDNHCHRKFNHLKQTILENCNWQLVEVAS